MEAGFSYITNNNYLYQQDHKEVF